MSLLKQGSHAALHAEQPAGRSAGLATPHGSLLQRSTLKLWAEMRPHSDSPKAGSFTLPCLLSIQPAWTKQPVEELTVLPSVQANTSQQEGLLQCLLVRLRLQAGGAAGQQLVLAKAKACQVCILPPGW